MIRFLHYRAIFRLAFTYAAIGAIYLFGPVDYGLPSIKGWAVFVTSLFAFFVFCLISLRLKISTNSQLSEDCAEALVIWIKFSAPIVLGSSVIFVYWLVKTGLSYELLIEDAPSVRSVSRTSDPLKQVAALYAYQAYLFIPILFSEYSTQFSKITKIQYIAAIILMAIAVVLQAGRTFFLVASLLLLSTYTISPNAFKEKLFSTSIRKFFFIVIFITAGSLILFIQFNRPGDTEIRNASSYVTLRYGESYFNDLGLLASYGFVSLSSYTIGPTGNFFKYLEANDNLIAISAGPLEFVFSRFPSLAALVERPTDPDVVSKYIAAGGQEAGWTTGFGSWVNWFGDIGAIIYAILLGWCLGRSAKIHQVRGNIYSALVFCWFGYLFVHSLFYFPTESLFFVNFTLLLAVIPGLVIIKRCLVFCTK